MLMTSTSPSQPIQVPRFRREQHTQVSMATAELSSISECGALATTMVATVLHTVFAETTVEGTTLVGVMERGYV